MATQKWIERYIRLNWSVIPVFSPSKTPDGEKPGKTPACRWTDFQKIAPTLKRWQAWLKEFPDCNLALVCGPISKTVAFDLDGPKAIETFAHVLGEGLDTWSYSTPRGTRYLFRCVEDLRGWKLSLQEGGIEFLAHGQLAILPPSLHECGKHYRWLAHHTPEAGPLAELPSHLTLSRFSRLVGKEGSHERSITTNTLHSVQNFSNGDRITELRNAKLFSYAGALLKLGSPSSEIQKCLEIINQRCEPPLSSKEILSLTHSIERYKNLHPRRFGHASPHLRDP